MDYVAQSLIMRHTSEFKNIQLYYTIYVKNLCQTQGMRSSGYDDLMSVVYLLYLDNVILLQL